MRYAIRPCTIWKTVASGSAISGLVCFALSSTYKTLFMKLGCCGLLLYLLVGLFMFYLILRTKSIPVSQKYQGLVIGLMFGVFCSISLLHDELVDGKPETLSITSYGLFALMSLSIAKKLEIGFEIGCSTFFLQLLVSQLSKISLKLLPTALVFCVLVIALRHHSEQAHQIGNGYHHPGDEDAPADAIRIDINEEGQEFSPEIGEVSGQSLLSRNNQQNNQEGSSQVINHSSPSNGQGGISELDNQQNKEEEDRSSLIAESSGNNMLMIPTEPGLTQEAQPQALTRRRRKKIDVIGMTKAVCRRTRRVKTEIQNMSNMVERLSSFDRQPRK